MKGPGVVMETKLLQLRYYIKCQFPIFPIVTGGKRPLTQNGYKSATTDLSIIEGMHYSAPNSNWAMRTGERTKGGSGILVIDIDRKSGGFDTWEFLRTDNPEPIETIVVDTGSGGQHWWFRQPDGLDIACGTGVLGPGIDIRANGGYALIPPSETDQPYCYRIGPREAELADLPEWLYQIIVEKQKSSSPVPERIDGSVPQGLRHSTLLSVAGSLRRTGLGSLEIESALFALREEKFEAGEHPISDQEVRDIVEWVTSKRPEISLTDLGNSERFVSQHGQNSMFCHELGSWFIWDGRRWGKDVAAEIMRMAYETVRLIYVEAGNEENATKRKKIGQWAKASESKGKIEAMVQLACHQNGIPVRLNELDRDTGLINCRTGIIDLRTGQQLPHKRDSLITKLVDVDYDRSAQCPTWHTFLDLVTGGDPDLQEFLQVAVGYSITGRTDEQCLFFLHGAGANGKTTFCETIRAIIGEYTARTDVEALLKASARGHGPSPYIAVLAGTRFALSSEIPEGKKLNESLVKDLTGGDTIVARLLYSNPVTFTPTHKLWLFGNYLPRVIGTDWGFWRRVRVIPFMVTIPKSEQLPMKEVLETFLKEAAGIFTWAIEGSVKWHESGLPLPQSVRDATSAYKTEQDVIQEFVDEWCDLHPDYSVLKEVLFNRFRDWCDKSNEKEMGSKTRKWFTGQLTKRGMTHSGAGRSSLQGIRLKSNLS